MRLRVRSRLILARFLFRFGLLFCSFQFLDGLGFFLRRPLSFFGRFPPWPASAAAIL